MSNTISKSELVNHLNESAYEMHKRSRGTSAGILLKLRDEIQSGTFDTPEPEQLRMSLNLAKKWLKDIEDLHNPTSPMASTALMELQAIEDQYPLGIKEEQG